MIAARVRLMEVSVSPSVSYADSSLIRGSRGMNCTPIVGLE